MVHTKPQQRKKEAQRLRGALEFDRLNLMTEVIVQNFSSNAKNFYFGYCYSIKEIYLAFLGPNLVSLLLQLN